MTPLLWIAAACVGILVAGLSAVTLAQREKLPCTACRQAHLEIQRDFMFRCVGCGARYQRDASGLRLVEHAGSRSHEAA